MAFIVQYCDDDELYQPVVIISKDVCNHVNTFLVERSLTSPEIPTVNKRKIINYICLSCILAFLSHLVN